MLFGSHPFGIAGHARQLSKDLNLEKSSTQKNKSKKPGRGKSKPSKPGKNAAKPASGKGKTFKGKAAKKERLPRKSKGAPVPTTAEDATASPLPSSGTGGKRRRKAA